MARKMLLLLFTALFVIIGSPIDLTASDKPIMTGLNPTGIVETVPLPEPVEEPAETEVENNTVSTAVATPVVAEQVVETAPAPQETVMPANAISVMGHVIPIVDVDTTAIDSGDHVNKYGAKFLYGHNSAGVFGDLVRIGVGNVFMVSYGGTTSTYQVAEVQIFEKSSDTTISSNGVTYKMSAVANGKGRYDMVLMTCYGTMYGNGDASHRFVVFANRV